jgi:2-keto-4-pentenoate hydratase/2-oxohepta-3-ene-1,7-dioic acid hydratase in catechol pathway
MKLISYRLSGQNSWGAVIDGQVIDLAVVTGLPTLAAFLGSSAFASREAFVTGKTPVAAYDAVELLPVIPQPEKIVCAVRNYMDHHHEAVSAGLKVELSEQPPIFLRVWRSQCAHNAPIVRPKVSESLDWEGELAVVIGQGGRNIPESEAFAHVAGYSCYNDASVREWQFHAKQIAAGKNFESTGGFGPWLVTADEIDPERHLKLEVRLNGEVVQSGDTGQMIFGIAKLISYASTIFTLTPGDVIVTGTPSGVGFSRKPPRFMKAGDVCEVQIEGIGLLRNPIVDQV